MIKILFYSIFFSIVVSAGTNYISAPSLGYEIAMKIIKKTPHAKKYEYRTMCIQESKKYLMMGYNLRQSSVTSFCLNYIENRDAPQPRTKRVSHLIDDMKR